MLIHGSGVFSWYMENRKLELQTEALDPDWQLIEMFGAKQRHQRLVVSVDEEGESDQVDGHHSESPTSGTENAPGLT